MAKSTTHVQKPSREPLRFAHPFFTDTPPERRTPTKAGKRMTDHVAQRLQPIPRPKSPPILTLADIIGAQSAKAIEEVGKISFHAVGDTGRSANSPQGQVADAMTKDYDISKPAQSP